MTSVQMALFFVPLTLSPHLVAIARRSVHPVRPDELFRPVCPHGALRCAERRGGDANASLRLLDSSTACAGPRAGWAACPRVGEAVLDRPFGRGPPTSHLPRRIPLGLQGTPAVKRKADAEAAAEEESAKRQCRGRQGAC